MFSKLIRQQQNHLIKFMLILLFYIDHIDLLKSFELKKFV